MHRQKATVAAAQKLINKGFNVEINENGKRGNFLVVTSDARFVTHQLLSWARSVIDKKSDTRVILSSNNGNGKVTLVVR